MTSWKVGKGQRTGEHQTSKHQNQRQCKPDILEAHVQQRVFWCGNASPHTLYIHTAEEEMNTGTLRGDKKDVFLHYGQKTLEHRQMGALTKGERPEISLPGFHRPSQGWIWKST